MAVVMADGLVAIAQNKAALLVPGFLDVVFLVIGSADLKADMALSLPRADGKGVGGIVFGCFDVVLVSISPVQLHLLPIIGNQVGRPSTACVAP